MNKLIARTTMRVLNRLPSYERMILSIQMEEAMCSSYGFPFTLPVDTMYERCYNEAAKIVALHFKCTPEYVLECVEHYLHLPQGPQV